MKMHCWERIIFILGTSVTLFVQGFLKYMKMYVLSAILGRLMYSGLKSE